MIGMFLSSLIVFCLVIALTNRRHKKMIEKYEKDFWDREARANNTRKKSLANLAYISIPEYLIPEHFMPDDAEVSELLETLRYLSTQKIVNLTGYTNTDLKLEYGTANITCLSEYDQNYTLLARTLQRLAEILYQNARIKEARTILEFAVSTGTDVSRSYFLLADLYDAEDEYDKKAALIEKAGSLRTTMKNVIVRTLQESGPYSGWLHSG
ncbi:MAG: hypothetical protein K2I01_07930 [Lachnospiraceae bacterium]|nr:hypothetical protein [Lachnospiraceae bacterium]